MNELPSGVQVLAAGFEDVPKPDVQRDEMDRGPMNQELINQRIRYEMTVTFLMDTRSALDAFEHWYTNVIKIVGWWDMPHPRTGKTIRVRLIKGERGAAVPIVPGFRAATVTATVEYLTNGPE